MSDVTPLTPTHSNIGPSGAKRWMNCGASVGLIARLGLDGEESGEEASRGTVAHHIAAECLTKNMEPWEFAGQVFKNGPWVFEVDPDMVASVSTYVNFVLETFNKYKHLGAILHVESRVKSACDPMAYGTADIRIEVPGLCLIIIDFKNGMGVIEPTDEQLMLYGEYSYECRTDAMRGDGEPKDVFLTIVQPRAKHPKGPIRTHATTVADLVRWLKTDVIPAIEETRNPDAKYVMGKWCTHCPALAHCRVWQDAMARLPVGQVDNVEAMSDEDIAKYRALKKNATKFFEAVDKVAFQRVVIGGKHLPGIKPVHKLGDRVWHNSMLIDDPANPGEKIVVKIADAALAQFKDMAKIYTPQKLLSPAQMEKLSGGKAFVSQWALKPTTGLTIADEDDPRESTVGLMDMVETAQERARQVNSEVPV